ncbi:hypothetical protein [Agaribacterium haliotis]|uniref:hypothetical protein n=1 Tax=Agaribacterium haliotis TaxID=2013869 RepID=UPI000BB55BDA|nr:hypothetical protein [Agaribacterium haliotis]
MYRHLSFLPARSISRFILIIGFILLNACGGSSGDGTSDNSKTKDKRTPEPRATQELSFAEHGELLKTLNLDESTFSNTLNGVKSSGTLSYASSDTAVATIDQQGVITLVAEGETTISAHSEADEYYLASSASFRLIVQKDQRLAPPQLSANAQIKQIKLQWPQVDGAHHYHLFRCKTECEKLPLDFIAKSHSQIIETTEFIYAEDNTAQHSYRVQACDEDETICSELSMPLNVAASKTIAHIKAPAEYVSEGISYGAAVAISANGDFAISAPEEVIDPDQHIKGAVYIYRRSNGQLQLQAKLTNPVPNSEFGSSLDMQFLAGQLVVSGISVIDGGFIRLMAHVYQNSIENAWNYDTTLSLDTQGTLATPDSNVAISDHNTIILSNGWGNSSAAVFQRSSEGNWQLQWQQQGGPGFDALASSTIAIDSSGTSFAIATVGNNQLRVNIYQRAGSQDAWQHKHEIIREVRDIGYSSPIALVDGLLAVGVPSESRIEGDTTIENVGAIHLYRQTAQDKQEWAHVTTLQPELAADTYFGYSLALSWSGQYQYLVAGADDPRLQKPVFMYASNGPSSWQELQAGNISTRKSSEEKYLDPSEGTYLDKYGLSLAISPDGGDVIIGASADADATREAISSVADKERIGQIEKSGAAYLF